MHDTNAGTGIAFPELNNFYDIIMPASVKFDIMKLIRLFLILLIGFGITERISAQEVSYTPYEKFDIRSGDFSIIGRIGDRIYTYHSFEDGYFLNAYNDAMEKQATVVLDFFPKKIYETKFIAYTDRIVVLYQSIESNKVVQHAALLDDMGRLVKRPVTLNSVKMGLFGPNRDYFSTAVSDNKKHIVFYGVKESGKELQLTANWLDDSMNVVSKTTTSFHAENRLSYGEGMVDNDGNFFLSAYTPTGAKSFADQVWLLKLPRGERKFEVSELPLGDKFAAGTYMRLDNNNGRIYIGGFYSDKKNGNYEGVLYTYYDIASHSFESRRNIALTDEIRNATGERSKKRAFNDYQVRQIIVKNDGGFVMMAEDYFITTRSMYGPGFGYYSWYYPAMGASIREYHYEDILAISYNNQGQIEWYSFVRKDQYSQEDGGMFSSYALVNSGGMLGFMFNDFNSSQSRIQLATLDADGQVNMRSLAPGRSDDWIPRSAKQIAAREIIVPCMRRRQICFAKVIF